MANFCRLFPKVTTVGLASWFCFQPAQGMTFKTLQASGGVFLQANGKIEQGDRLRLVAEMDKLPFGTNIIALALESPGGSIFEAEKLATTIRSSGLSVLVPPNQVCASACFLLFAAGVKRFAFSSSLVGVHSASEDGKETLNSLGFTTAMARDAAGYGVPEAIIGRIVTTEASSVAWLSGEDLALLGTKVMRPEPSTSAPNTPHNVTNSETVPAQEAQGPSQAFQSGISDRRAMEAWMQSLTPDQRLGAEYWASQRSLRKPGSCFTPPDQSSADFDAWSSGCAAAQVRFKDSDVRRKTEPDYKAGWNSF